MTSESEWNFTKVAGPYGLTEGPAWDGKTLLFTEVPAGRILRYDPWSGATEIFRTRTNNTNGLMFYRRGELYACEGGGRCITRYSRDGSRAVIAQQFQSNRLNSPNDLAIDQKGHLWFSDPRYTNTTVGVYGREAAKMELDHESVHQLVPQTDGTWSIKRMTYDTTKPNGILLSPDCSTLYVAQSDYGENVARELRAYPIQDDDTLGEYEVLHNFYSHRGIDGMCFDSEGNILAVAGWEVSGPGGLIYVFSPQGRVLETHPTPCSRPTNCSWGDEDLQTLYVTSFCGGLYRARTPRKGRLLFPPA